MQYVYENGIIECTGTGEFSPSTTLNRAMFWTMLARLDGAEIEGGASWY